MKIAQRMVLGAAAPFAVVFATGCGAAPQDSDDLTSDGEPLETSSAAASRLSVDTWRVDFGRVPCSGFRFPERVSLRNADADPVSYRAEFRGGFRSPFEVSPASGTVYGNGWERLDVRFSRWTFTPLLPGLVEDELQISSGFGFPERVPVRATIVGALLRQSATSLDFDSGSTLGPRAEDLEIENVGNEGIVVYARSFPPFEVTPPSAYLSPRGHEHFTVTFDPTGRTGYQSGRVQLDTYARECGEPLRDVWVRGNAN